jgi:alanine racemase
MELNLKRPAWIEIDLSALAENYSFIRSKINNKTKIAAVVKANAYGHGAVQVAKKLSQLGVEYFCVGSPDEGIELRKAGIKKPILVLAEVLASQYSDIIRGNLIQTAASLKTLKSLNQAGSEADKIIKIHLKFDTGMGRIGFFSDDLLEIYQLAKELKYIKIEGIFSHFATADEQNKEFSHLQFERFKSALNEIEIAGFKLPQVHIANSAAVIDLENTDLDLVRPGIMLYGLPPSDQLKKDAKLKPVLSFKTKIVQLRDLPAGSAVSYGSTYKTKSEEKLAVLPVGYKDGYPRLLSNRGEVLIRGQRAPIRGRVCMGQTIVSVEHIKNVEVGDEVVLIGSQGNDKISASEIADLCGTINYEIVCGLSERLEKVYFD